LQPKLQPFSMRHRILRSPPD